MFLPTVAPPEGPGDILVQRDLGRLFDRLIEAEAKRIAQRPESRDHGGPGTSSTPARSAGRIAAHSHRTGGVLDAEDLAAFRVVVGPSVSSTYRGLEVHACGPWSQGPLLPMILNLLEGVDVRRMGTGSAEYYHHVAEAIKLACADREAFFGDPALVDVPIDGLLHAGYAEERRRLLDPDAASPGMPAAGDPWRWEGRTGPTGAVAAPVSGPGHPDTSYVCAMDADGNAFSATPSDSGLSAPLVGRAPASIISTQRLRNYGRPRATPRPSRPGSGRA